MNSLLNVDGYKTGHKFQYPQKTEFVYSNWTPRGSRIKGIDKIVHFGLQRFIKKWLIEDFNQNFFQRPKLDVCIEYKSMMDNFLGKDTVPIDHIEQLWDLGYLPLRIKSLPEGSLVPMRVPAVTIINTLPEFFWLTNYIETMFSAEMWGPTTSATIAREYRKILDYWCEKTGGDADFVQFQGHDFSMRGMYGAEAAKLSGMGHLTSFVGTDTIPAIVELGRYYAANFKDGIVGCSVPASEHAIVCAGSKEGELETFRRLIEDVYPTGIVSLVSDSWDLWKVLTEYLPQLKDKILARDGKVVIRPDSGDPVDIICGTPLNHPTHPTNIPESKGVIEILWDVFGGTINTKGYKVLDPHIGAIYGDSITLERAQQICQRLESKGFCSTNIVFGIGSFTYTYNTRDTFGFAMKATWCQIDGQPREIFKDPKTDNGLKKSLKGLIRVVKNIDGDYIALDQQTPEQEDDGFLQTVFLDGKMVKLTTLSEIRNRIKNG